MTKVMNCGELLTETDLQTYHVSCSEKYSLMVLV
jgi:hypothetical protein